ncbi:MAG: 4'-phosphopantetheinyl transferase family protein [Candidatus Dormibacteria bacterium]
MSGCGDADVEPGWCGADDVHVWQVGLDVSCDQLDVLAGYLSTEERDRADRSRNPRDRVRIIAARGWLRHVLGGYVDNHPRDLAFTRDEHGKPRLAGKSGEWLRFNASHSDGAALYAVARGRGVGVDLERVRDDFPVHDVARRFFPQAEQEELWALPRTQQVRAFFDAWTRKEAYLKAIGIGLRGLAVADVDVSQWSLQSIDAGPEYSAALVVARSRTAACHRVCYHTSLALRARPLAGVG